MFDKALEMLMDNAGKATERLGKIRAQITTAIAQDLELQTSDVEMVISAQHSVRYWTQVTRVVTRHEGKDAKVQALNEWVQVRMDNLLSAGIARSTSLVEQSSREAGENELKLVLAQVRRFLDFAGNHG